MTTRAVCGPSMTVHGAYSATLMFHSLQTLLNTPLPTSIAARRFSPAHLYDIEMRKNV